MIKKILLFAFLIYSFVKGEAQIYNIHNFYTQNLFYYNPAHTGDKEQLAAFIVFRDNLTGIENAGQTASVGLHSPLTGKMNFGGLIKSERLGLIETLSGRLDYAFRTKIAKNNVLAFGINVGAMQRAFNNDGLVILDPLQYDPTLNPDYIKKNVFFAGAGLSYKYKNFEFDLATPVLYKTTGIVYSNYWSFMSYSLYSKSKKWEFKPSSVFTYGSAKILTYQINLFINYENVFWVQPTYKVNGSIAVSLGVNLKKVGLAYAYETNSGALSALGGPSHEIMISYGFFKHRKTLEDTLITDPEYNHKLKAKIGDKTYEEYVSSNNYGFYNNIIALTDSMHKEEVRKIEEAKNIVNTDSIEQARLAAIEKARLEAIEQARLDSIEQAIQDSIRQHHLRHLSEQEMKILEKGVHFELGSAMLSKESREYLNKVAGLIKNNSNIRVLISGHTCDIGSEEVNTIYSRDRAEAVSYYLISKGVSASQISTDLKLDAEPIVPNTSEANRKKNRRVSFSIIKE
ncbi:MAG: PorP/SprF family type IX secretion system membrane protein [Bacteroidales bacterium]|nr:PorP/SprF family type IX secretion system membrane protein [Bacteroidales bacterium]